MIIPICLKPSSFSSVSSNGMHQESETPIISILGLFIACLLDSNEEWNAVHNWHRNSDFHKHESEIMIWQFFCFIRCWYNIFV